MPQHLFQSVFPITCDICTHAIRDANQGMLMWARDGKAGKVTQALIVHNPGHAPECNLAAPGGVRLDTIPLWEVTDVGGLVMLCENIKSEPDSAAATAEVIQRLHVPGYDRIRFLDKCNKA